MKNVTTVYLKNKVMELDTVFGGHPFYEDNKEELLNVLEDTIKYMQDNQVHLYKYDMTVGELDYTLELSLFDINKIYNLRVV